MTAPDAMPEQVEQPTVDEIQAGTAYITADPVAHKVCNWMIAFGRRDAESRLLAAEARVREIQAPVMCSVCVGRPLPSGRPCICGDTIRTEAAEMHGLRVRCFELEDENAALRADLKAAQELEQLHLQNLDAAYAERDALVPLARFAMRVHDTGDNTADAAVADGVLVWVRDSECDESPAFTQARSILAREAGGA